MSKTGAIYKYLRYRLTSGHKQGGGIHSPFVYSFIREVLLDKKYYSEYQVIESIRKQLLKKKEYLNVSDLGAGSRLISKNKKINQIAKYGSVSKKYGRLLFRLVRYFKPANVVELGTALGISTLYLASSNDNVRIYTIEGNSELQAIANQNFKDLELKNIESMSGNFDDLLPALLTKLESVDMAFVDGNHRKDATIEYFNLLKKHSNNNTVLIFDDIHWSAEMEEAWNIIKANEDVTVSIDLFFVGIVFMRKESTKQNFIIQF